LFIIFPVYCDKRFFFKLVIMRRKDREIIDRESMLQVLKKATICRIAMSDNGIPYIVPLNFGFEAGSNLVLYFHCAPQGRKLEILRTQNNVCFEAEADTKVISGQKACDWSMQYRSVIGYGVIEEVKNEDEKVHGMNILMRHYAGDADFEYDPNLLKRTTVLKLTINTMTGKEHLIDVADQ
jgi:uncharacterized protein